MTSDIRSRELVPEYTNDLKKDLTASGIHAVTCCLYLCKYLRFSTTTFPCFSPFPTYTHTHTHAHAHQHEQRFYQACERSTNYFRYCFLPFRILYLLSLCNALAPHNEPLLLRGVRDQGLHTSWVHVLGGGHGCDIVV